MASLPILPPRLAPRRILNVRNRTEEIAMTLSRRAFLSLTAGAAALPAVAAPARPESYPSRPVRIVVGFTPGGSTDIAARVVGEGLSERLAQPFVIENRPGAGATIAAESVVRAPPDGYTLLLVNSSDVINATLYQKLKFNFIRDIAPVASVFRQPQVMLANPSIPAKSFAELIAYAKAHPAQVTMASPGNGSIGHLAGELLKMMAGVDFVHVPYRGAVPALTDLLAGHLQMSFAGLAGSMSYLKTGQLRALAVTTTTRSDALPAIPAVSEFVPGYEAASLFGIGAPKQTPAEIVDRLNKEINAALGDRKTQARFADLGGTALVLTPVEFEKLVADETEKWGKVIRAANIKAE